MRLGKEAVDFNFVLYIYVKVHHIIQQSESNIQDPWQKEFSNCSA